MPHFPNSCVVLKNQKYEIFKIDNKSSEIKLLWSSLKKRKNAAGFIDFQLWVTLPYQISLVFQHLGLAIYLSLYSKGLTEKYYEFAKKQEYLVVF